MIKKVLFTFVFLFLTLPLLFSQNILMIGDSHTKGNTFPLTIKKNLRNYDSFTYKGRNGYTLNKFTKLCLSKSGITNNDIIIVSFGTNESYLSYNATAHYKNLNNFYQKVKRLNPRLKLIFLSTIPNRIRINNKLTFNKRCKLSSDVIRLFSNKHNDCFFISIPLLERKYYQSDNVHLTAKGYEYIGDAVGKKIRLYM